MAKSTKTKILFLCIGNMIRSQMAEGFAREYGSAFVDVYSAGFRPTGVVSLEAIEAMDEKGIDISNHRSKGVDAVPIADMDYVISLATIPAADAVPRSFRGTTLDWPVDDPLGQSMDTFRGIRDRIDVMVREFVKGLWKG